MITYLTIFPNQHLLKQPARSYIYKPPMTELISYSYNIIYPVFLVMYLHEYWVMIILVWSRHLTPALSEMWLSHRGCM